jgi:hypothetical protein
MDSVFRATQRPRVGQQALAGAIEALDTIELPPCVRTVSNNWQPGLAL